MPNKVLFDRDVEMPIERLRDEVDLFDKVQELVDEGMIGLAEHRVFSNVLYGLCDNCEEMHPLCPVCEFCLEYCHDPQTCGIPCWPEDD
jgi:hypothetical protein